MDALLANFTVGVILILIVLIVFDALIGIVEEVIEIFR